MPYKNREKQNEYQRTFYRKHRRKVIDEVTKRKKEIRTWFNDYKKTLKCTSCDENHPATLHFHHHKKDKDGNVCDLVSRGLSKDKILKEVSKCIVLCANCHAKKHWNEQV